MTNRKLFGCLSVIGLALVGAGALVVLNRDSLSKNIAEALDTSASKTEATLFRWGELMSIGAELKDHYGIESEVTYDTSTSDRTLNIRFANYQLPEQVTIESHAREIAAFAIGKTKKFEQIDVVRVLFQNPSKKTGVEAYTFARVELTPSQP